MNQKRNPSDTNQLAALIVERATSNDHANSDQNVTTKDPAAVSLGRRGGLKGGKARADALSPRKRREIAKRAAEARWKKAK